MDSPHDSDLRRFPRARERIPVKLKLIDGKKQFEATVFTCDVSLSGAFFASSFFLKAGSVLDLEFKMPNDERMVRVRGIIVREVRLESSRNRTGFAMRFVEYYADAKTILASSFLIAELDGFLDDYLQRRSVKPVSERDALRDVIIGWEVGKMELKGGELDIMKDRITVDKEGRIRRRSAPVGLPRSTNRSRTGR